MISESANRNDRAYAIVFLLAGVLAIPCPFVFTSVSALFTTSTIRLFSLASLSGLAVSFILFRHGKLKDALQNKRYLSASLSLFLLIVTVQFCVFNKSDFDEFFLSLFWISVPLFVFLFSDSVTKLLPPFVYIFWIVDLLVSFYTSGEKVGIPGNRNWHASFLLVALLFSTYLTYRIVSQLRKTSFPLLKPLIIVIYLITSILIGYTAFLFYKCNSRAATLAALVGLLIFVYSKLACDLTAKLKKISKKYYFLCLSMLAISLIALVIFFVYYSDSGTTKARPSEFGQNPTPSALLCRIKSSLKNDVRIPLWAGALNLIRDYPLIGTSPSRFESIFAAYRPLEYFTKPLNAVRSDHPHNSLLHIATSFGIFALVLWCFLWVCPMVYCFAIYSKLTPFMRVTLFAYFCLFFHGLLDLVLFHWPTIFLAALCLGLLWAEVWKSDFKSKKGDEIPEGTAKIADNKGEAVCCRKDRNSTFLGIKILIYATAIVVLILTLHNIYLDYQSSYFFRTGDFYAKKKRYERALFQYQEGLAYKRRPKYVYKASVYSLSFLDNPELALHLFKYFDEMLSYDYAHKNGFIALAFVKLGKYDLALPYLMKEVVNYPLSVGAWYRLSLIQRRQEMYKEASISLRNMERALKAKGLPPNALSLLIKNPEYDSHPDRIPKGILAKLRNNAKTTKH